MQSSAVIKLVLSIFVFTSISAHAGFKAQLQGKSRGSATWIAGNLQNWRDLDEMPCRVHLTGGPANNKVIKIEFDRMQGRNPGIQDLYGFASSANVAIVSPPVLSAPANSPRWTYTFTIKLLDTRPGSVAFTAKLAAGAHLNGGSSVGMRGSPALGNLQIHKISPAAGIVDLTLSKTGPSEAAPGQTITYTLQYSNKASSTGKALGVQLSDTLPALVTVIPASLGSGRVVGNTVVWSLNNLSPGASGSLTYSVRVKADAAYGAVFTNVAVITSCNSTQSNCKKVKVHKSKEGRDDDDDGKHDDDDGKCKDNDDDDGKHDDDDGGDCKDDDDDCEKVCPSEANPHDNRASVTTRVVFNRAPVAANDQYAVLQDTTLNEPAPGVLANDTDPDNNPLRAILVGPPANGTVILNANGSFVYVPATSYHGEDSFTYKANDGMADSATAMVLIRVMPKPTQNNPPVALNDQYTTATNSVLNIMAPGVLANDFDADGDEMTAVLLTQPAHGTLTFNANGSFEYAPAPGFAGTDTYTYKASDGVTSSLPATVTLLVQGGGTNTPPTNLPPVISLSSPTNGAVYIAGMDIPLVADASDPDGTVARVDFFIGELLLGSDLEPEYALVLTNAATGEYVFRAMATDNDGATTVSTPVSVTVIQHPPFAAGPFRLNRQTGLFEQTVTITNPTPVDFPGIRLWIMDVRTGATVWNATGQSGGIPYIDVLSITPAGGSVQVVIEYYTPDIRVAPQPAFLPEVL